MSLARQHYQDLKYPHLGVIDGLRALAVLMIVWFHIWQQSWLSSDVTVFNHHIYFDLIPRTGFLGVELLLFISGFGLFLPYAAQGSQQKMVEKTEVPKLKDYVFHRFIRIVPSYYLCILIAVLVTHPFQGLTEGLWQILTHLLFIHNLFPETWGTINGVLWTLGIEVQFYLIFPLLAYFFTRKPYLTFPILVAIAIIYRFCTQALYHDSVYYYVNQMPGFLDLYASGMIASYLFFWINHKFSPTIWIKILATLGSIFGFGLFIFMLYQVDQTPTTPNAFSFWQAFNRQWLALIFIFLTLTSLISLKYWRIFLANKLFVFISIISYNLYLYHQLIAFQLEKYHLPKYTAADPHNDPIWQIQFTILTIILSLIVATILTYGFEKPLIKWGLKRSSR
jgi:peptidoglycan/LPS O-acetylase OafA/YrhL